MLASTVRLNEKRTSVETLKVLKTKLTLDLARLVKENIDLSEKIEKNDEKINAINLAMQLVSLQISE